MHKKRGEQVLRKLCIMQGQMTIPHLQATQTNTVHSKRLAIAIISLVANSNTEEYEVEQILDSRLYRRQLQYLVRWEGYDLSHDQWIPAKEVHTPTLTWTFHERYPWKPGRAE